MSENKAGRPKGTTGAYKADSEKKGVQVAVRMTAEERVILEERAEKMNMPISRYIHRVLFEWQNA